mmetsp:Transcript_20551/g.63715  ORF Transcript_20551/g.63715 Transcript_20551/m.63715 type:complete len:270 (-) Transcript_20551:25-834(-)
MAEGLPRSTPFGSRCPKSRPGCRFSSSCATASSLFRRSSSESTGLARKPGTRHPSATCAASASALVLEQASQSASSSLPSHSSGMAARLSTRRPSSVTASGEPGAREASADSAAAPDAAGAGAGSGRVAGRGGRAAGWGRATGGGRVPAGRYRGCIAALVGTVGVVDSVCPSAVALARKRPHWRAKSTAGSSWVSCCCLLSCCCCGGGGCIGVDVRVLPPPRPRPRPRPRPPPGASRPPPRPPRTAPRCSLSGASGACCCSTAFARASS